MKDNHAGSTLFTHARSTLSRLARPGRRRQDAPAQTLPHRVAVRPSAELDERLRQLHDDYVWEVNSAVEDGREDLAEALSNAYADDALHVLATHTGGPR